MRFYRLFALLPAVLLFNGCFWAPGMVFDQQSDETGDVDTLASFQGARVRIQSINPKSLSSIAASDARGERIPPELLKYDEEPYKLGSFDLLQVVVWEHPELTMPLGSYRTDNATGQLVMPDGNLFYPYVGSIPAAGKTVNDVRTLIQQSLSKVLNNPQIDVRLLKSQSRKAYVQGAVLRAGVIPLSDIPVSFLEAINSCGGLSEDGDASRVEFTRDGKSYIINLLASYPAGAGPADIVLKSNDVIRVGSIDEARVYVMGEVGKQQALPFHKGRLSLSEALADAGGLQMASAKSEAIYVFRIAAVPDTIQVYHLNSRNPLALVFGDRFLLKPNDIVYVDATGLTRWNRLVSELLPTAQMLYYSTLSIHSTKVAKDDLMNW